MTINNKQCILHIGAPKTGSTALQKMLTSNRAALSILGWEYPDVSLRGFGHHDLAFLISGEYPKWATSQERPLEDLVKDLTAELKGKRHAIISSENFYLFPKPQDTAEILAQAGFPPETVFVAAYVRRQDEVHISWYNQAVKAQGYTGEITECIAETMDLWDYAKQLEPWAGVFGRDNIIIRPYQPEDLVEESIYNDFLRLAGLSTGHVAFPETTTNTRINRDILEFQRLVNRLPLSVQEKRRFHRELIELTAAAASMDLFDDSPFLTADQRQEILSSYAASNAHVAKTYLGREHLFNETIAADPPEKSISQGLIQEKLVYILGWILAKHPKK
ncbi:MAG: hypothetical protein C4548_13325 [Desulfobacteraceae bacterium]|nr:MAG: hypothetical protein C4548_13325 [Desulfobacteraceae bacterium]